jgi:hypothetical protein
LGSGWQQWPSGPKALSFVQWGIIFRWVHCLYPFHYFLCHITDHLLDPPRHLCLCHIGISLLGCTLQLLCPSSYAWPWAMHWVSCLRPFSVWPLCHKLHTWFLCLGMCPTVSWLQPPIIAAWMLAVGIYVCSWDVDGFKTLLSLAPTTAVLVRSTPGSDLPTSHHRMKGWRGTFIFLVSTQNPR